VHDEAIEIKEGKFTVKTHECQADGNIKVVSLMQLIATREFIGKDQYDCELFRAGNVYVMEISS